MKTALETYKTAAEDGDGDFLSMAMKFRAQLPTKQTTQLRAVDNFVNAIRNIPKANYNAGLLAAYSQVTKIIASTISYRLAFNQYYISFLKGAKLGDPAFYYSWNAGGYGSGKPRNIIWTTTPGGLDACTVANFVSELNLGCVSKQTPGFANLTSAVQITVNQGPGSGIRLSCDDLNPKKFTGCWIQGRLLPNSNANCFTVAQQASVHSWPPQQVKDFCSNTISSTSSYTACNYDGYSQGPAACQKNANLYSCSHESEQAAVIV